MEQWFDMQAQLQNNYPNFSQHLPGQQLPWLRALREQAFAEFMQQGIPTIRAEAWKYTNLHRLNNQDYTLITESKSKPEIETLPVFSENLRIVFIDGILSYELSTLTRNDQINFVPFSEAVLSQKEFLEQHLKLISPEVTSAFPALNTSMATDGAVIEIAQHKDAGIIEIVYFTSEQAEITLTQPRTLIKCAAHSKATIVEHYAGAEAARSLTNSVTQIEVGQHAHIQHIKLQTEAAQTDHIGQLFVNQHAHAHFSSVMLSFGANIARNEIHSVFSGEHSTTELFGLFLAQHAQHMDQYTLIDHASAHCDSLELYRGILLDNSRGVFNGRVIVKPHAVKSNAKQANNNLLLSSTAEIDTKPQLQIYNDDVQCTHGATVGQLDQQALFYLRARGLSLEKAKSLLLYAFAAEILDKVTDSEVHNKLQHLLSSYLPSTEWLELLN